MTQRTIQTPRLILRPFCLRDAQAVQHLAGDWEIADTTSNIPHPYEDGMAETWIETNSPGNEAGALATFAIVLRDHQQLIGAIGLTLDRQNNKAELGYWVGKSSWNLGYATEAAKAILEYGFVDLRLNRIGARHFARNPSSGRVMQKVGMLLEGKARQATIKWGKYEDLILYGILHKEWASAATADS